MNRQYLNAEQFQADLAQFNGSEKSYYRDTPLGCIEYTDGIRYLQQNGCLWIVDAIASYQTPQFKAADDRQFWKLRVNLYTHSAELICDDGNGNIRVTQNIELTDFSLSELHIYVEITDRVFLCLMSEY